MVQFLSTFFFFWISSIFVVFSNFLFFCVTLYKHTLTTDVIILAIPIQQQLHERTSMLRCTYIAYLAKLLFGSNISAVSRLDAALLKLFLSIFVFVLGHLQGSCFNLGKENTFYICQGSSDDKKVLLK